MTSIVDDFKIRIAKLEDIDGIMEIDKELGGFHPNLDVKAKEMIANEGDYFLVATLKEKVVGYAGGSIRDTEFGEGDPVGYITHVGLTSQLKSKGMGSILGDRLVDKMSDKCDIFRTILSFDRIDLQSFFNNIGFSRTDFLVYEYTHNR
ncbi:MAG: GNAT family N-acetyltransferase [Candidatus Kariarchaeaceae archaeon]|jgi:N-acetylglutamate synthase-like GNAT family acetyltransferase